MDDATPSVAKPTPMVYGPQGRDAHNARLPARFGDPSDRQGRAARRRLNGKRTNERCFPLEDPSQIQVRLLAEAWSGSLLSAMLCAPDHAQGIRERRPAVGLVRRLAVG